jgi:hypothetical protein
MPSKRKIKKLTLTKRKMKLTKRKMRKIKRGGMNSRMNAEQKNVNEIAKAYEAYKADPTKLNDLTTAIKVAIANIESQQSATTNNNVKNLLTDDIKKLTELFMDGKVDTGEVDTGKLDDLLIKLQSESGVAANASVKAEPGATETGAAANSSVKAEPGATETGAAANSSVKAESGVVETGAAANASVKAESSATETGAAANASVKAEPGAAEPDTPKPQIGGRYSKKLRKSKRKTNRKSRRR